MKWVFVIGGLAMAVIGSIGKYVDMTKYKEPFISGNSPWYTVFMTGIIAVILGLSFDWIMSLDDEEEEEIEGAGDGAGEGDATEAEAGQDEAPEPEDADAATEDEPSAEGDAPPPETAESDGE